MLKFTLLSLAAIEILLQDSSNAYPSETKRALAGPLARSSLLEQRNVVQQKWKDVVREKRQDDEFNTGDSGLSNPEFGMGNPGGGLGGSPSGSGSGSGFSFNNIQKWFSNMFQKVTMYFKNVLETFSGVMQGMGGGQSTGSLPSEVQK